MTVKDILTPALTTVSRIPPLPMWQWRLSAASPFCRAVVAAGYLSQEQMERAAQRYRLGCSRDGAVIFWQIDELEKIYDGKLMYYRADCHRDKARHPDWVSSRLKKHYGCQHLDIPTAHCLFGQHLLRGAAATTPVAVVEAEKTAVILSELFPGYLWMATGGLKELSPEKLFALHRHPVVLFPDTDECHASFKLWYDISMIARRDYGVRCFVSPLLELKASAEEKARKIDLVDFLDPLRLIPEQSSPTRSLSLFRGKKTPSGSPCLGGEVSV